MIYHTVYMVAYYCHLTLALRYMLGSGVHTRAIWRCGPGIYNDTRTRVSQGVGHKLGCAGSLVLAPVSVWDYATFFLLRATRALRHPIARYAHADPHHLCPLSQWVFVPMWGSIGPAVWAPVMDMWWCAHVCSRINEIGPAVWTPILDRTEQNRTEQNRTEHNRTWQRPFILERI
jgi:hypothetical protein